MGDKPFNLVWFYRC